MIIRKIFLLLLIVGFAGTIAAQQDVQYSQYYHNKVGFNPGFAGSSGSINLNVGHRSQWVGFENAPTSQNINADIPLALLHGGILLNIVNDEIGFFQDIAAAIGYAYQLELGPGKLGIGLSVDFKNKNVKQATWIYPDGTAGASDPSVFAPNATAMTPEMNFGAYYSSDFWYGGLSSSRLLQSSASLGTTAAFKSKLHYYLTGGLNIPFRNLDLVLSPNFLVKSDLNSNLSIDMNINAVIQDKIYGGLGYRNQDALSIMAGYQILPSLRLAYSYDITTSSLAQFSGGSHEVFLNYSFNIEVPPRTQGSYRNIRFL